MTTNETLHVVNPATGEPITTLPAASADDVAKAAEQARRVHDSGVWSRLPVRERGAVLLRLADLMERDAEILARLDSEDAGKPITECRTGDVPGAIESIRWFAEAADKTFGRVAPSGPEGLGLMSREPVGVVAAILPWNYPLAMTAWKVGPALAAGNCLLVKPAEATPRSALHLAALAAEAGLPDGVLTVLPGYGRGAGTALARNPLVGALSFTGSTETGRRILKDAAESNFKRVSLEMGGKSPQVLMADALSYGDELIDNMIEAAFVTTGQNCTAGFPDPGAPQYRRRGSGAVHGRGGRARHRRSGRPAHADGAADRPRRLRTGRGSRGGRPGRRSPDPHRGTAPRAAPARRLLPAHRGHPSPRRQ